jgi:channel protein (hemolysin III family)
LTVVPIYSIPGFAEPVSSMSHLLGAAVFAVASLFLLRRGRGSRSRIAFLSVYIFSGVFLLSMSGVYHMLPRGSGGWLVLERLDHAAIFVLIAGTFTPVHGILFQGPGRWGPLLLIWALAATGITLKTIFLRDFSETLSLSLYLGMGWIGIFSAYVMARRYGLRFLAPLVWGALAYTGSAILEFLRWPILLPGVINSHELFHLGVLVGVAYHWLFIFSFANGTVPAGLISPSKRPLPVPSVNGTTLPPAARVRFDPSETAE